MMSLTGRPAGTCRVFDLALAAGVLYVPHPLLAADVHLQTILRWPLVVEVQEQPPEEQ